jgi:hypothetical protein
MDCQPIVYRFGGLSPIAVHFFGARDFLALTSPHWKGLIVASKILCFHSGIAKGAHRLGGHRLGGGLLFVGHFEILCSFTMMLLYQNPRDCQGLSE